MKVNVDFDLNWIGDEDTIDDAVSRKIISRVVDQVGEKIIEAIKKNVDEKMAEKIDSFLETVLEGFLDRNIIISDKWGNEAVRYENVNELLETKFDEYITVFVDSNGKTSKDRHCNINGTPRVEYLVKKHISDKIKDIELSINKEISDFLKIKLRQQETQFIKQQ